MANLPESQIQEVSREGWKETVFAVCGLIALCAAVWFFVE